MTRSFQLRFRHSLENACDAIRVPQIVLTPVDSFRYSDLQFRQTLDMLDKPESASDQGPSP